MPVLTFWPSDLEIFAMGPSEGEAWVLATKGVVGVMRTSYLLRGSQQVGEVRTVSRVIHSLGELGIVHILELPSQVHGLAVEAGAEGLPGVHPTNDEVQYRAVGLFYQPGIHLGYPPRRLRLWSLWDSRYPPSPG